MNVKPNWTTARWAEWTLEMLNCTAEIYECGSYHSGRDWCEWSIKHPNDELWARGTTTTPDEAKRVVEDLVSGRWNARAAHAS